MSGLYRLHDPGPSQRLQTYARGDDFMAGRMMVLQVIADQGPMRKADIMRALPGSTHHERIKWLSEHCYITVSHGSHISALYSATSSGRRRLKAGDGEPVPPRTITHEPYRPSRDTTWGYVPPERLRALLAPSVGWPT